MNVLAFGAHPDDLECYCAGTLLKCKDRGDSIFVALTTSGNTGSNSIPTKEQVAAIREAEQLKCCAHYGAQTRFLRFEDEGLLDIPETRKAVLDAIRWAEPDLILVNPPWDPSPDHGMTGKLVTQVLLSVDGKLQNGELPPLKKMPSVFFFPADGCVNFTPDIYVDISDKIEEKCRMMLYHGSQQAWANERRPDEKQNKEREASMTDFCRTISRYIGIRGDCRYAEGFVAYHIPGYAPNYKLIPY